MKTTIQDHECKSRCEGVAAPLRKTCRPVVDIISSAEGVTLRVDLPGAEESSIDVTLDRHTLSIRAPIKSIREDEGLTPLQTEYGTGDYERKFRISDDIDRDNVDATFQDGVLTLKLMRTQAAGPRKVKISVSPH